MLPHIFAHKKFTYYLTNFISINMNNMAQKLKFKKFAYLAVQRNASSKMFEKKIF